MSLLPIKFKNGKLIITKGALFESVSCRKPAQERAYLKNPQAKIKKPPYWMYRGIAFRKDKSLFKKMGLRYDITVISPMHLGKEFDKTIGHYHNCPEIYEVLSGKAIFLFQEKSESPKKVFLVKVKRGEKVFIPKGLEHITINPSKQPLVLANIIKDKIESHYGFFKKHRGAAYYAIASGNKIKFEKNPNYKKVGKLINGDKFKVDFKKSLYKAFMKSPSDFNFLKQ